MNRSRRDFLKWLAGAGLVASGGVSASLVQSILGASTAAEAANAEAMKHLLLINLHGAPPRWMFDLWLKPNPSDPFIPNLMTHNAISEINPDTGAVTFENRWIPAGFGTDEPLDLPNLWRSELLFPTGSGSTLPQAVPMTELLRHWLSVRSGGSGRDGHTPNNQLLVSGGAQYPTIAGAIADGSAFPIPALLLPLEGASGTITYRSAKGVSAARIYPGPSNPTPAQRLLAPFSDNPAYRHPARQDAAVWGAVGAALSAFRQGPHQQSAAARSIFANQERNETLLGNNASRYADEFPALAAKYDSILNANLRAQDVPGVSDQPIRGISFPMTVSGLFNSAATCPPIAARMVDKYVIGVAKNPETIDLRSALSNATVRGLAYEFSLAEMAFKHQLSSGVVMTPASGVDALLPATIDSELLVVTRDTVANTTTFSLPDSGVLPQDRQIIVPFDAHLVGSLMSLLVFTAFFRALSACIHEFSSAIGSAVFDKTVIEIASEFNRSARSDGAGSDHGFDGTTFSFISGAIEGTYCIGDIWERPPTASNMQYFYTGTWGYGAPCADLAGITLNQGNILASLAAIFGVASPSPNSLAIFDLGKSLLNRGKIVAKISRGRNTRVESG
jgi:hypothetical protein